ncbi:MAG: UDP-N-acetylmuramoyl-L-alanyl-D-glutamate--2,6-diaminopimelate ligase [Flavobacteriaceae bacterium]|nr:UDP-N-acetylmuramoyl-L-alanyl-D-glutamate--2,6-diaminopimelate ligase [Flavobacteriaceae bacterium]
MKNLKKILYGVSIDSTIGMMDKGVCMITSDSRLVKENYLFVAINGSNYNGNDFINQSIEYGASVIVSENFPREIDNKVTYIKVENIKKCLAIISNNFYEYPSEKIKLIGITGTNGKTTCATLMYELFNTLGYSVGLISTLNVKYSNIINEVKNTTPDSLKLNYYLSEMIKNGVEYCFMEVSSHGIDQYRVYGQNFHIAVFTNLSHDHLDYHKTYKKYRDTKKIFFDNLSRKSIALVNNDDKNSAFMIQNSLALIKSYGLKSDADFKGKIMEMSLLGTQIKIGNSDFWTQLTGEYNISNLIAVYSVALLLKLNDIEVLSSLSKLKNVSGRFDIINLFKDRFIIIDYAHTPDALMNVLKSINKLRSKNERLITLIGCGGNRDESKRPIMGKIASHESDKVILTSDNPRFENPIKIIDSMYKGIPEKFQNKVIKEVNRKDAIKIGVNLMKTNDILLIAGKGHEKFQDVNGKQIHFDEKLILKKIVQNVRK